MLRSILVILMVVQSTLISAQTMLSVGGRVVDADSGQPLEGVSVVESWIVEDVEKDKTALYGLNAVEGAWAVVMRINNEEVWQDVKKGIYKGLSIEGYFADKMERPKEKIADFKEPIKDLQEELKAIEEAEAEYMLSQIKAVIKNDKRLKKGKRTEMESFSDYPQSVSNNAKRGIELNKKVNNKCATQVGKVRAQQLADRKPVSMETIKSSSLTDFVSIIYPCIKVVQS